MKTIGIRQADGSFYPILEEDTPGKKTLGLTTAKDNQTRVIVDMYRSENGTMEDAEYVDSLQIDNLVAHAKGSSEIKLNIGLDADGKLSAELIDPETGLTSSADVTLVNRTLEERLADTGSDFSLSDEKIEGADQTEEAADEDAGSNAGAFAAGAAAGAVAGGLLAAAMKKGSSDSEDAENVESTDAAESEETVAGDADSFTAETAETSDDSFDLPDFDTDVSSDVTSEIESASESSSETVTEESSSDSLDTFDLPDFDSDLADTTAESAETSETSDAFDITEPAESEETVAGDADSFASETAEASDDSFDLPDFDTDVSSDVTLESESVPESSS